MVPTFHLADGAYAEFYKALLPDFVLAAVFFTTLCYAVLGRRFAYHQRAAVVIAAVLGISLAIGLVWWEQQHGYSIRNLGPIAVGLAIMFLAVAVYQAFRLAGGTIAGAGIAIGVAALIAWMLQVDWLVAHETVQTIAGAAIIIGLIAFFSHRAHRPVVLRQGRRNATQRSERVDADNLYDAQHVSEKLRRGFRNLKQCVGNPTNRSGDIQQVPEQLRRMLPAEGWLTQHMAQLREKAYRIRRGHVARIDGIRNAFGQMSTQQKKRASLDMIAQYKSLKLDVRLGRLDQSVAANEKRIRKLTRKAQGYAGKYAHRHLYETLKEAEKLQKHNSKLLQMIRRTEEKLDAIAKQVMTSRGRG